MSVRRLTDRTTDARRRRAEWAGKIGPASRSPGSGELSSMRNESHECISFDFIHVRARSPSDPIFDGFLGGSFSSFRAIRGCSPSSRPVHPQVDVVSQKRKKVEWGITNELVRPSVGQVRSGRGRQHRSVCMGICHPYQSDRRPTSKDRKPQRTTQKFSPGYLFCF